MRPRSKFFALFFGGVALGAVSFARGESETFLRVRAHTQLELRVVRRVRIGDDDGVRVEGVLVDVPLGRPVSGRTVAIDIEGRGDGDRGFYRYAEPTTADGAFRFTAPLPLGRYVLRLLAGGDARYGSAAPVTRSLDMNRSTPSLQLHGPALAVVEAGDVALEIDASEEPPVDAPLGVSALPTVPVDLPLTLLVDDREVVSGRSVAGVWHVTLGASRLGSPGHVARLSVRFAGDSQRNPSETTHTVTVATQARLDVRVDADGAIAGILLDAAGPSAGATIVLTEDATSDHPVERAQATTKPDGTFAISTLGWARGRHQIRVTATPTTRWRLPATADVSVNVVLVRDGVGRLTYFAPALVTLLLVGGIGLRRRLRTTPAPPSTQSLRPVPTAPAPRADDVAARAAREQAFDVYARVARQLGADPHRRTPRELLGDVQQRRLLPARFARFVAAVERASWGRPDEAADQRMRELAQLAHEATHAERATPLDPGGGQSL